MQYKNVKLSKFESALFDMRMVLSSTATASTRSANSRSTTFTQRTNLFL